MSHGGRRAGAGRPAGSGWKPAVSALRVETVEKMKQIVGSENDPLSCVVGWVLDDSLAIETRLSAAHVALPFLYPRLNASTVDTRNVTVKVDATAVLERLTHRIERMISGPEINGEAEAASANTGQETAEIRQFSAHHSDQPTSLPTIPTPEAAD